jgi:hypothetical protein
LPARSSDDSGTVDGAHVLEIVTLHGILLAGSDAPSMGGRPDPGITREG